jgi:hypothetical protein
MTNIVALPHMKDARTTAVADGAIDGGGGGPHPPDMDARLTTLEQWSKIADARMARVEEKLDRVSERLAMLPTTNGLWGMIATVLGVAVTVVGVVLAAMAYRQDTFIAISDRAIQAVQPAPTPPQPIIIQIPVPAAAISAPAAP